jgi:aarF domain-containing kinase
VHDFIHGDLHPGNILVSGKYPNLKYQVLDCGLALEMGPKQHENIVKVLGAFTRKDGRVAGQTMVEMRSESQATAEGKELFINGIEEICDMDTDQNFIENVGDYITDICSLACIHRVKLEGAFVNAALAVEIMEGLASALYPDLRVQQVALPLVMKAELMVSRSLPENIWLYGCTVYQRRKKKKYFVPHILFFNVIASIWMEIDPIILDYHSCCIYFST